MAVIATLGSETAVLVGRGEMMIGPEGMIAIRMMIVADETVMNAENPHRLGNENRRQTSQAWYLSSNANAG